MRKSIERIIEEKLKLEELVVEILSDAAYAERFISKPSNKVYKFPKLDMYQLQDHLAKMPDAELNKLKEEDLLYGWILKNEKKHRKNN